MLFFSNNTTQRKGITLKHIWASGKDGVLTSGSRFLKTYILVFSIIANRSGLSFAHFMSQTSFRSNLDGSPADAWFPSSPDERPSRSNKVNMPAMSIMAKRLKIIMMIRDNAATDPKSDLTNGVWAGKQSIFTWNCSSMTGSRLCCSKCTSG